MTKIGWFEEHISRSLMPAMWALHFKRLQPCISVASGITLSTWTWMQIEEPIYLGLVGCTDPVAIRSRYRLELHWWDPAEAGHERLRQRQKLPKTLGISGATGATAWQQGLDICCHFRRWGDGTYVETVEIWFGDEVVATSCCLSRNRQIKQLSTSRVQMTHCMRCMVCVDSGLFATTMVNYDNIYCWHE